MNRYKALLERIQNGEQILIDGATGSEVERRGVPRVQNAWSGGGALTHPDIVREIHEDYIRVGANIIISNTFSTSRHILQDAGIEEHFELLNRRGVELAIEARSNMNQPHVLVAGGITNWTFTKKHPSLEQLKINMADEAHIMAEAGADLLMLEMMIDIERMLVVLEAAQSSGLPVWVGFSCEVDDEGVVRLWDGPRLEDAIDALQDKNVPLISIMHTDVKYVDASLDVLQANWSGFTGVYAHSEQYDEEYSKIDPQKAIFISPEAYAAEAKKWVSRGINIIGGCCSIGVDHMKKVKSVCNL